MIGIGLLVLLALIGTVAVRVWLVIVTVRGNSMLPTYRDGDVLLAVRHWPLRSGRTVVFRTPPWGGGPPYRVKRLIAVAGEPTPGWVLAAVPGVPVPPGRVVVRGDADGSEDSKHYGYVSTRHVIGVVAGRLRSGPVRARAR